jgi:integrase
LVRLHRDPVAAPVRRPCSKPSKHRRVGQDAQLAETGARLVELRVVADDATLTRLGARWEAAGLKTAAARRDVILMAQSGGDIRKLRLASPFSADHEPRVLLGHGSHGRSPEPHSPWSGEGRDGRDMKGVTFHVLRHTIASILIAQGHDPVFVSRQLGHANAAITLKVYAHLFDAARHAQAAREQLEADYGPLLSSTR